MSYLIALILIIIAGIAFAIFRNDAVAPTTTPSETLQTPREMPSDDTSQNVVTEESSSSLTTPPAPEADTSTYADGPHTSSVTYMTPKRSTYRMDVTLTLTQDTVADATIVYAAGAEKDPNAQRFEKAYRAEVVGKKINNLNLSRVGGASLTTNAFNEAVDQIKAGAQS